MRGRKLTVGMSILLLTAILLSACGATPTPVANNEPPANQGSSPTNKPADTNAPQPTPEPAKPVAADRPYRIAMLEDMTSLNVWNLYGPGASTWNYVVQAGYYPTLYTQSLQRYDLTPWLAADFASMPTQEGDFWVSTIAMKHGMMWSDGTEITAEDVAFTANTATRFQLGGNWLYYDSGLDHAEALDPYTVKFYYSAKPGLAQHEYGVLQQTVVQKAFWEPLITDAVAALDALQGLDPASDAYATGLTDAQNALMGIEPQGEPGCGPYVFSQWEVGAYAEDVADPDFSYAGAVVNEYANGAYQEKKEGAFEWGGYGEATGPISLTYTWGPKFSGVLYTVYSQDAAVMALLNGDVDYIMNPSGYGPGLKNQLQGDSNVSTVVNPQNGFRMIAFNFNNPVMADPAVRQALACMIDVEFLTTNLLQGAALPMYTVVPEQTTFWHNPNVTRYCVGMNDQQRMEWAVARLKEAGYTWDTDPIWNPDRGGSVEWGKGMKAPDGSYIPELRLIAPSMGYDPLRATTGVFIEQWANQLGLPVRAELTNFNNIRAETIGGGGNFDIAMSGWGLGGVFPNHLCTFFRSDAQPFNFMNYNNPEVDALCDKFEAATTMEEAQPYAWQLQEILASDLPYFLIFTTPIIDAYRPDGVAFPTTELLDGLQGNAYGLQLWADMAQ